MLTIYRPCRKTKSDFHLTASNISSSEVVLCGDHVIFFLIEQQGFRKMLMSSADAQLRLNLLQSFTVLFEQCKLRKTS